MNATSKLIHSHSARSIVVVVASLVLTIAFGVFAVLDRLTACPFCSAPSQTLRQDMASMDVVTICELVGPAKNSVPISPSLTRTESTTSDVEEVAGSADFRVIQILRGNKLIEKNSIATPLYYGPAKSKKHFLLMGVAQTEILWSSPLAISDKFEKYLTEVTELPDDTQEHLKFYVNYLESDETSIARDAYDEFAQSPYDQVKEIKSSLNRIKLIEWIKSPAVPVDRKRLYFTLLGIVNDKSDSNFLEALITSKDEGTRAALDALIGSYLTIKGEAGLQLIHDEFITNKKSSYTDTFAAVMALRFHGNEGNVLSREKIIHTMESLLDRPDFADLVIPDLARWEDWSQVEKLSTLFIDASPENSWIRLPVINYLRACPLPIAKQKIAELEKIDPKAVKRAATFFPIPAPAAAKPADSPATSGSANDTSMRANEPMRVPVGARGSWFAAAVNRGSDVKTPSSSAMFNTTAAPAGEVLPELAALIDQPESHVNRTGLASIVLLALSSLVMCMFIFIKPN